MDVPFAQRTTAAEMCSCSPTYIYPYSLYWYITHSANTGFFLGHLEEEELCKVYMLGK